MKYTVLLGKILTRTCQFSTFQRSREAAEKLLHPNVRNSEGMTPLHIAVIRGYEEMTNLLLRRGAHADAKNYTQLRAPLHLACQYNHPRVCNAVS